METEGLIPFLQACLANPEDVGQRLIMADWMRENGWGDDEFLLAALAQTEPVTGNMMSAEWQIERSKQDGSVNAVVLAYYFDAGEALRKIRPNDPIPVSPWNYNRLHAEFRNPGPLPECACGRNWYPLKWDKKQKEWKCIAVCRRNVVRPNTIVAGDVSRTDGRTVLQMTTNDRLQPGEMVCLTGAGRVSRYRPGLSPIPPIPPIPVGIVVQGGSIGDRVHIILGPNATVPEMWTPLDSSGIIEWDTDLHAEPEPPF